MLVGASLPDWNWSEEMRAYWAEEDAAYEAGDLDRATELNLDFWVKPARHEEVRPQQRRALELQAAVPDTEPLWLELPPLWSLTVPTLVVVGEEDKADFRAIAEHIAREIPDAELAVVAGRRPPRRARPARAAEPPTARVPRGRRPLAAATRRWPSRRTPFR